MNQQLVDAALKRLAEKPQAAPDWCLFWQFNWELTCMPRGEWASWMQALAGVIALLIALGFPLWQSHQAKVAAWDAGLARHVERHMAFLAVARAFRQKLQPAVEAVNGSSMDLHRYFFKLHEKDAFRAFIHELDEMRVGEFPTIDGVKHALDVRDRLGEAVRNLDRAARSFEENNTDTVIECCDSARTAVAKASAAIAGLVDALANIEAAGIGPHPRFLPKWLRTNPFAFLLKTSASKG